jgi:TRAP-type mannitol/chloroaromatic compound transport system permease large subunit
LNKLVDALSTTAKTIKHLTISFPIWYSLRSLFLLAPFVLLVVSLLIGFPIASSLAGAGIWGILIVIRDLNTLVNLVGMVVYDTVANYMLTTLPMFILMAFPASLGGLAEDLFKAASNWLGHLRGGSCNRDVRYRWNLWRHVWCDHGK